MRSLRAAINQTCKDCIYDPAAPGAWRQQVEGCTVTRCGLHPVRPRSYQGQKVESSGQPGQSRGDAQGIGCNALRGGHTALPEGA